LVAVGALLDAGHEPRRIAEDVLRSVRDAFLLNASGGQVRVDAPEDEQRRLDELGRTLGNTTLVRVLETLGQAVVDMRGTDAADPRLVLEIALVRLTRREVGPPIQTVMERIEKLEQTVAGQRAAGSGTRPEPPAAPESRAPGVTVGALRKRRPSDSAPPADTEPEAVADAPDPAPAEPKEPTEPKTKAEAAPAEAGPPTVDVDDVILAWATVLPELSVATRSAVQEAQPLSVDGDVVTFGVSPRLIEAARPRFRREANTIRDALSRHVGTSLRFNLVPHEGFSGERAASAPAEPPEAVPDDSDDVVVEPDEGATPPGVESTSPASMLTESLGATVVEERHHE
jgi:DNA polymerase-3 subunit gamma/tau